LKDLPINFEQPIWLLLPILLVSIAISAFLYYRNSSHSFSKPLSVFLFLLRALSLFILGVLLLNPYFVNKTKVLEKPQIVVAVDISESMYASADSLEILESVNGNIEKIKTSLSHQFDIDVLSFDGKTHEENQPTVLGKRTDIGQLLYYVRDKYYMLNMSALILLSDGQINQGINPEYAYQNQSFGIYPLIYGDTNQNVDIAIQKLYYNSIAKQNAKFSLDVVIQAKGMSKELITVDISHQGRIISSKKIKISTNDFTKEINFELDIKGDGLQGVTVNIRSDVKEVNSQNNSSKFYVQMVETGQKILVLGSAPHPDLGALASALKTADGFEVNVKTLNDYPFSCDDYQLVILHGLPSADQRSDRLFSGNDLKNKALWYLLSTSTDYNRLNRQDLAWQVEDPKGNYEHTEAIYRQDFSSFKWDGSSQSEIENFPPLYAPFSNYKSVYKSDVMLWQSIRDFQTDRPLLSFWTKDLRKYALLSGEGLWKWRIHDFQSKKNHELFNSFVVRVSNYLLTGAYDDNFTISYENVYHETDRIEWNAQVYNHAFETIEDAAVSVELTNESGDVYSHQFTAGNAAYSLNLDYLKSGAYSFEAIAKTNDTSYVETGKFVVDAWSLEQTDLSANTDLLQRLASISHGKTYDKHQVADLNNYLLSRDDFKPRYSISQKLINLIDMKWMALLLLILVSLEWFLRKRGGSY